MAKNRRTRHLIFYIMRTTIEWMFVRKLIENSQMEFVLKEKLLRNMHEQVGQVVTHYLRQYVCHVNTFKKNISCPYDETALPKKEKESLMTMLKKKNPEF